MLSVVFDIGNIPTRQILLKVLARRLLSLYTSWTLDMFQVVEIFQGSKGLTPTNPHKHDCNQPAASHIYYYIMPPMGYILNKGSDIFKRCFYAPYHIVGHILPFVVCSLEMFWSNAVVVASN